MYLEEDVTELLEEYGTVIPHGGSDAFTVYTEEDGVHGLVTVEDLLDGRPPQPGHDTYRIRYRGVDAAAGASYTDHPLLAGSLYELEESVEAAMDRIQTRESADTDVSYRLF